MSDFKFNKRLGYSDQQQQAGGNINNLRDQHSNTASSLHRILEEGNGF
jgi:hypothetical protein